MIKDTAKLNHDQFKKVIDKNHSKIEQIRKDYIQKKSAEKNKSLVEDLRSKSNTRIGMGLQKHLSISKSKEQLHPF